MLQIGTALDVGRKRQGKANQDYLAVVKTGLFGNRPPLFVLADGMGGYRGGENASHIVVNKLGTVYRKAPANANPLQVLKSGILEAHKTIKAAASKNKDLARMGSTVVAAIIQDDTLYLSDVGDSHIYLINQNEIRLVSWDHSFVADQVRAGLLSEQEALTHPKRNVLTMSLTARRESVEPYLAKVPFGKDDILLMCSDGLWGPVPEAIIHAVAIEYPPKQATKKLVELANANQGPDNISVIIACDKGRSFSKDSTNSNLEDTQP
jgi:protein phosphatase